MNNWASLEGPLGRGKLFSYLVEAFNQSLVRQWPSWGDKKVNLSCVLEKEAAYLWVKTVMSSRVPQKGTGKIDPDTPGHWKNSRSPRDSYCYYIKYIH